jgi:Asp-tRNA(Asn)/Glu-tRNA(Gln) amidotransferase B subunit
LLLPPPTAASAFIGATSFTATFAWTTFGGAAAIKMKQISDERVSKYYEALRQKTDDQKMLQSYAKYESLYKNLFGFTEYSAMSILSLMMSSSWILDELSQAVAANRFDFDKHTFQTEDLTAYVAGIALGHLFFAGSVAYMYIKNHMK